MELNALKFYITLQLTFCHIWFVKTTKTESLVCSSLQFVVRMTVFSEKPIKIMRWMGSDLDKNIKESEQICPKITLTINKIEEKTPFDLMNSKWKTHSVWNETKQIDWIKIVVGVRRWCVFLIFLFNQSCSDSISNKYVIKSNWIGIRYRLNRGLQINNKKQITEKIAAPSSMPMKWFRMAANTKWCIHTYTMSSWSWHLANGRTCTHKHMFIWIIHVALNITSCTGTASNINVKFYYAKSQNYQRNAQCQRYSNI